MNSKEALIQLVGNAIAGSEVDVDVANWLEDIIEKDLDELLEYKRLEKELGIDLITLFIALKNGVYYRFDKKSELAKMKKPMLRVIDDELCLIAPKWITTTWMNIKLKDYGKTWALTKEELE